MRVPCLQHTADLFAASLEAEHDRHSPTPLLLTFAQAAELLGVGEATVRELVGDQEPSGGRSEEHLLGMRSVQALC